MLRYASFVPHSTLPKPVISKLIDSPDITGFGRVGSVFCLPLPSFQRQASGQTNPNLYQSVGNASLYTAQAHSPHSASPDIERFNAQRSVYLPALTNR